MRRVQSLALLLIVWGGLFAQAAAPRVQGFVEIEKGRSLFIDWKKAEANRPTVVLLNGLTYETPSWGKFADLLESAGFGVFRYDPMGMGRTLARVGRVDDIIHVEDQAKDLDLLTRKVGLTGKLNLLGLSYGGGLALVFARDYASRIGQAILMSPYTEPLGSQDQMIKSQMIWFRLTYPLYKATDDELYSYFLRQNVYYVYPLTEPSMLDTALKPEAVFQMTQGIRKYDIRAVAQQMPSLSVHLMVAGLDQYIPRNVLNEFWAYLPRAARASRVIMDHTEHKIPQDRPEFAAQWVARILNGDPQLQKGKTFQVNPLDPSNDSLR